MSLKRFGKGKFSRTKGTTHIARTFSAGLLPVVVIVLPPFLLLLGGRWQLLYLTWITYFEMGDDGPSGLTLLLALVAPPELRWRRPVVGTSLLRARLLLDNEVVIFILAVVITAVSPLDLCLLTFRFSASVIEIRIIILMEESAFKIFLTTGNIILLF